MRIGNRIPGVFEVAGRDRCTTDWLDLSYAPSFQLATLSMQPLDGCSADCSASDESDSYREIRFPSAFAVLRLTIVVNSSA
jgi:hypothetical protein